MTPSNSPISLPVVPAPPPGMPDFNTASLNLFQVFNRATYLQRYGVQAPNFDATRCEQSWFDSSQENKAAGATVTYKVAVNGQLALSEMTILCSEASAPNLYGPNTYLPYAPDLTTTALDTEFPGSQFEPINATMLCSYTDALTLSVSLNGPNAPPPIIGTPESDVTWNTETRRIYMVQLGAALDMNGNPAMGEAAALLAEMWTPNGVGAPGTWDTTTTPGVPKWNPAPVPDYFAKGVRLVPCRDLNQGETIVIGIFDTTSVQAAPVNSPVPPAAS